MRLSALAALRRDREQESRICASGISVSVSERLIGMCQQPPWLQGPGCASKALS
jgi:hypothetical protein